MRAPLKALTSALPCGPVHTTSYHGDTKHFVDLCQLRLGLVVTHGEATLAVSLQRQISINAHTADLKACLLTGNCSPRAGLLFTAEII